MTQGNISHRILSFTLPVLLGNLFQNLYNMVDAVIVGQCLGVDALAAVGSTGVLYFFVIGWVMGVTGGFGVKLSHAFGANDKKRFQAYLEGSVYLCIGMAIVMTTAFLYFNLDILRFMNTPEKLLQDTGAYMGMIYIGLPISILYNMLATTARAMGDSKTPLYFLILSSFVNVGLDILFVAILPFGVFGAALATVMAQGVSAILCCVYMWKRYSILHLKKGKSEVTRRHIFELLMLGVPMGLQFSITSIGAMIVQSSLNLLGPMYIASYAAAMKIQSIMSQPYVALGITMANFVGQNYGAGNMKRVQKGMRFAVICILGYSILAIVLIFFAGDWMVSAFVNGSANELKEISRKVFRISIWFYPFLGYIFLYRNGIQGLGKGLVPMLGGAAELVARVLVIVCLFESLGFIAVCLSDPIAWVIAVVPLMGFYYHYFRKSNYSERNCLSTKED